MGKFKMCVKCGYEYSNVYDRRFHAQPVACNDCGPEYSLAYGQEIFSGIEILFSTAAQLLDNGKILAVKGTGGYHLACNALDHEVVSRLRFLKNREAKPFAVMFASLEKLREFAFINLKEEELLTSWQRPVVLLKLKKSLPESVNDGLDTIGAMLPYMPFHYFLFEKLKTLSLFLPAEI